MNHIGTILKDTYTSSAPYCTFWQGRIQTASPASRITKA